MQIRTSVTLGALALALSACGGDTKTEVVAEQSDMVVETPNASDVPVTLPTTPMTNGPASGAASEAPAT